MLSAITVTVVAGLCLMFVTVIVTLFSGFASNMLTTILSCPAAECTVPENFPTEPHVREQEHFISIPSAVFTIIDFGFDHLRSGKVSLSPMATDSLALYRFGFPIKPTQVAMEWFVLKFLACAMTDVRPSTLRAFWFDIHFVCHIKIV